MTLALTAAAIVAATELGIVRARRHALERRIRTRLEGINQAVTDARIARRLATFA